MAGKRSSKDGHEFQRSLIQGHSALKQAQSMDIDVVITVAGLLNRNCHELARYQLNIVLLEKEDERSFGVSKSNSGIIHTGFQSKNRRLRLIWQYRESPV